MFSKAKTSSKAGFDKVYTWVDKLGAPVNRLSNKVGSEAFWPTTLDIESDKAARILKSFCSEYLQPCALGPLAALTPPQRMAFTRKKNGQRALLVRRRSRKCSRKYPPR